jgi:nucleotide-binding universal stress UspA family protein
VKPIVVGIDGSDGSRAALAWAVEEARLRRAPVCALHAWHHSYATGLPFAPDAGQQEAIEAAACQLLDEIVDAADASDLVAPIERRLVLGGAATALIVQSDDAELVVVGARGLGGFLGLVMGSVSSQVVNHAHCPVVVVKPST